MTGTDVARYTHKQSRSYLNHLIYIYIYIYTYIYTRVCVCVCVHVLVCVINPLNAELNPICHLLALIGSHHILHVSMIRVK